MMPPRTLLLTLACLSLAACYAPRSSRVDANWGSAQRDNSRAMIANPSGVAAIAVPDDPTDGLSAQNAMRKHRTVEARPPRQREQGRTIINIGGN
jgi:hypothetical protein